jgi:uncharacterized protein (DUF2147 family)
MLGGFSGLVLAAHAAVTIVAPSWSPSVFGLWSTAGDEGLVRIEACGAAICGRIADSGPATLASTGPSHDQAVTGMLIMKLKPTGPGRWGEGWIRNPDDGKTYKASVTLTPDGRLRLRGCLVFPLCRTQTWRRAGRMAGATPPQPPS